MLKMEHLRKTYGTFSLDCTMEIRPGCVTGLVGQNGSGKSTTFKAALGLISTEGGTVRVLGKTPQEFNVKDRQELGVVLADSGFSGYLTMKDIVPILEHLYDNFDKAFFLERARKFRLPEDKKFKEFSTGMKAKLKVITAVSHNARLLILDEPTAGLGGHGGGGGGTAAGVHGKGRRTGDFDQFAYFQRPGDSVRRFVYDT